MDLGYNLWYSAAMDYTTWTKEDLIKRLLLVEAFEQALSNYITQTCPSVSWLEAAGQSHTLGMNGRFYIYPDSVQTETMN